MTVTTTLDRQYFDGDGSNKVFPFNFRFFTNDQIYVSLISPDGTITPQLLTTNYTLSGALQAGGGTVTMIVAPPLTVPATRVFVQRILPQVQPTSIRNQGKFYPEIHEDAFDRLTMLIQQALAGLANALQLTFSKTGWNFLGYKGINVGTPTEPTDAATKGYVDSSSQGNNSYTDGQILRTVRGGAGEVLTQLPPAASRASKVMGFDASGNPIGILPASGSGTELAIDLANSIDPNKGAGLVGWRRANLSSPIDKVHGFLDSQMINIWEYEFASLITIKPNPLDPSTWDWTPAIQAAVNATKGTGKKLYIPEGTYIVSTSGTVVSPPYLNHPYAILVDANLEIACNGKIMIPMDPDKKCIAFLFDGCTGGGLTGGFAEGFWSDIDALTTRLYNGAMAVITRSSRVNVSGISTKNTGAGVIITSSVGCTAKDSISIRTDIRVKTGAQYGNYAGSLNLIDGCVVYGGTNDGDISLYGSGRGNRVVRSSAFNYFLGDPTRTVVNLTGQGICVDAGQVSASVRDSAAEGYYYGIDVKSGVVDCDIDRNRVRGNKVGIACRRGELDQQMTTCRVTRNNINPENGNGSTSPIGGFSTIGLYVQDAFGVTADGNTIGVIPITGGSVENWIGVYASLTGAVGDNDNNFAITNNRFTFHDRLASMFAYNTGPLIKVIGDAASRLNFKFSGNTLKLREGASTVVQCEVSSAGMVEIKDNPLSGPNSATLPFYSVSSSNTLQFNGNILRDCATVLLATDVRKVSIVANTIGGGLDSAVPHFKLIRPGSVLVNDNTKWTQTSPPFSDSKFLEVTEQQFENLMFSGNIIRATNQSSTTYYSLNGIAGKTGTNIVVSNIFMSV